MLLAERKEKNLSDVLSFRPRGLLELSDCFFRLEGMVRQLDELSRRRKDLSLPAQFRDTMEIELREGLEQLSKHLLKFREYLLQTRADKLYMDKCFPLYGELVQKLIEDASLTGMDWESSVGPLKQVYEKLISIGALSLPFRWRQNEGQQDFLSSASPSTPQFYPNKQSEIGVSSSSSPSSSSSSSKGSLADLLSSKDTDPAAFEEHMKKFDGEPTAKVTVKDVMPVGIGKLFEHLNTAPYKKWRVHLIFERCELDNECCEWIAKKCSRCVTLVRLVKCKYPEEKAFWFKVKQHIQVE